MLNYRTFRNNDPPQVRRLWQECGLGRGAALGIDSEAFETVVFAQPYFDPEGLIFAVVDGQVVGYVHAGFCASRDHSTLDRSEGVICALMVLPAFRRQGIGRELSRRAEAYLSERGASTFFAGPAHPRDPFYFGIYGGSQPAGFLESDALAAPFFGSQGYAPVEKHFVFQRNLVQKADPVGLRLMALRRTTQLAAPEPPMPHPWWWVTRPGRLESVELSLTAKSGCASLARVTVVGLDYYLPHWNLRGIGLMDLHVDEVQRRKGYGQALLVEVCRRVRSEMIQLVEAHASESDTVSIKLLETAGFERVDTGIVYRKE